ncbi:uncharacterized protein LOC129950813 [Eupeodes corollae]|uniref:uncharacterized protein LOC129950813 n=1 Tax=Eupeodes corollae TaxID=290404 RepID=UPI002492144B|nr:uncharacterized protein LOC129950813 [Eupeodes corollae]
MNNNNNSTSGDDHLLASHTDVRHLNDYDNRAFQHTITGNNNNNNNNCVGIKSTAADSAISIPDPDDLNAIYVAERTCRHHRNKRQRHNATQTPDLGYPSWKRQHHTAAAEMDCCAKSCCCYCCHCHCHPHHHCHGAPATATLPTTILPHNNQRQKKRITAAKRLPELPSSKHLKLAPESSQSLSSPDDVRECGQHHRNLHHRHPQRRQHKCRLPEKIPTGGTIAIEIDAATLTDDISCCSSISNHSFAIAMANETTNSKDILVHCSGDNHHPHEQQQKHNHQRRRKSRPKAHHCEPSSHIDTVCSTPSTTTEDEVIVVQRKCKRGQYIPRRQDTIDGAADVEEDEDENEHEEKLTRTRTCCDVSCCRVNESVKIKRKQFNNRNLNYCSSCSKCSSCSCCQQELDGVLHKACSFSSSLSHIEDDGGVEGDDEVCSRCDAKGDDSDAAADHSSSQQSAESFCSCNSTSRCYCSCSCDESDTIRKDSASTTPATMSDVSTPVEAPYEGNFGEDAFSMAGKSSVSQSEYFSLSSDKPPSHSVASTPASPPDSVMPSPPALPRKHCKHYSKHHRHKTIDVNSLLQQTIRKSAILHETLSVAPKPPASAFCGSEDSSTLTLTPSLTTIAKFPPSTENNVATAVAVATIHPTTNVNIGVSTVVTTATTSTSYHQSHALHHPRSNVPRSAKLSPVAAAEAFGCDPMLRSAEIIL